MPVRIPDDSDFSSFKDQCLSPDGWSSRYHKGGVTVWCREQDSSSVQKIKMRIVCKDVTAETLYDVLHDTSYRKCPTPLKNRDFVTMRSWLPLGSDYMIINYSVKHPQHPPKKDYVRAVSLLTGYLIQSNSAASATLYYLTQVDPRGSLPKWVVNRVSQFVAPKAMRKIYKASLKYPEWKRKHDPTLKPWMYPEQNTLPSVSPADLTLQRADSLENIDESGVSEEKAQHSDDEET
ncbi:START domain-containing protein 10 isoform X2 [Xiphophorus couchianus]|uniref:START domain-containing protein 10 isoform X2 n=1 Tax=Xiphophorus couchianus TaxID=32473 RepID=UPI0010171BBE|nr:START domain-containing protein 10-like isoform X2 [Xiphophorus couchianus]